MSFEKMLSCNYVLYDSVQTKDAYGTPIRPTSLTEVERGRCAVKRNIMTGNQGNPALEVNRSMRVYLPITSQVRAGHIIDIDGTGKLTLAQPYRIRSHHIEAEGEWSDEA